ncbi:hypothetical protein PSTG_11477 [Puccinia striiformis f. sp. tritici PST-78]|uniref:Uncharacterized protein n=1 Tax=Puccinia striiformis f. sp. tritici PST-78 TaxID=1165861 RepID=A0A0L0V7G3_9BASI|nr:hypothetical protein PSTG_11477 [Puccinia striiformis f. sp. tritici PST-78]
MALLKKISKKHLQVGARTWRPPKRDHLNRNILNVPPAHQLSIKTTTTDQPPTPAPATTATPQTTTYEQLPPTPTPIEPSEPPQSSRHSFPQPLPSSSHSQNYEQHNTQRNSAYSHSLNDAHQPAGSYRSRNPSEYRHNSNGEHGYLDPNELHSQSYPPTQNDHSSHHLQDHQSVHPHDSASQLAPSHPQNHPYASSCGSELGRERLRAAEADHQAALQRLEDAHRKTEYNEPGQATLSDTDIRLQQTREQVEEHERKLEEIRKAEELLQIREREVKLREEQLEQLLREEREKFDQDAKRVQEVAERKAEVSKLQAEEERQRQVEIIKREAQEKEELARQELAEQVKRIQEQTHLKIEAELKEQRRREEEDRYQAEMEHLRLEAKEKEEAEAQMFAEREASYMAERDAEQHARLAMRDRIAEKELAMQNARHNQDQRRADLLALAQPSVIRSVNAVSYADRYSSPLLGGYSLPTCPPTPRSPHLVPESVRKAARAHQARQEMIYKQYQEQEQELAHREQERLWEEQKQQTALRQRGHSIGRRDGMSSVDERHTRSGRSHDVDHQTSDHRSQATQSAQNERSKSSYQRSRPASIDRRDGLSNVDEESTRSAQPPQRDHHPIPPTDSRSRAGQPAHMDSSETQYHRERAHSSGRRRDGLSQADAGRLTRSARPAPLDYSAQVSDHGSQAGTRKANSSTSSQQPSGGGLSLHDRIKSELEHRDNEQKKIEVLKHEEKERRKIEDNMIAKARADFEQAKAREQARAKQSREQTVPEAQPSVDQQSYASERTDVESKTTAEKRAAQAAAHFMTKQNVSTPASRSRKTSMPHASPYVPPHTATHRRVVSQQQQQQPHHHQRYNLNETVSLTHSEPISEPDSTWNPSSLDHQDGHHPNIQTKELENSLMLPLEHPSPCDYLENHPRGRQFKLKGDELARKALIAIARNLGADRLDGLRLRPPVPAGESHINFAALGTAVFYNDRSSTGRAGLEGSNPKPNQAPKTPKQSYNDPVDPAHHESSPARDDDRVPVTPALSEKSEPFDNSEPTQAVPHARHPLATSHTRTESRGNKNLIDRDIQTSIGPSNHDSQNSRSPSKQTDPNRYDSQYKPTEISTSNQRDRYPYSPRVLEEEKHFGGLGGSGGGGISSERAHDLPIPPRFVTPKVTVQSPSDTTSPNYAQSTFNHTTTPKVTVQSPSDGSSPNYSHSPFNPTPTSPNYSLPAFNAAPTPKVTVQSPSDGSSPNYPHSPFNATQTPKVTVQSPSDGTSPTHPHSPYEGSPKPFGNSSPVAGSSSRRSFSPATQATSHTRSPSIQHSGTHQRGNQAAVSPKPNAEPPTVPPAQDDSPIPGDFGSTSRVTNTDSRYYPSTTNSPNFRIPSSSQAKASSSRPNRSSMTLRQSAIVPATSILSEHELSRQQRSASRASRISHVGKSTPTSSPVSSTASTQIPPEGSPEAFRRFSYDQHGGSVLNERSDSHSGHKRSVSRTSNNTHHGKSDSTHTTRSSKESSVKDDSQAESKNQDPLLTENPSQSNSPSMNQELGSPGQRESGQTYTYTNCLYSSPATMIQEQHENLGTQNTDSTPHESGPKSRTAVVNPPDSSVEGGEKPQPNKHCRSSSTTTSDESSGTSFQNAVQASIIAKMLPVEEKINSIVAQASSDIPFLLRRETHQDNLEYDSPDLGLQQQQQEEPAEVGLRSRLFGGKTPIPDIKLWSPSQESDPYDYSMDYLNRWKTMISEGGLNRNYALSEQKQKNQKSPIEIPLPPETPHEKPLPPPTPCEFPLPDSPSLYEFDRTSRRTQSHDFRNNLGSILGGGRPAPIKRSSTLNSHLFSFDDDNFFSTSSYSSRPGHQPTPGPSGGRSSSRLSNVWIGDHWDILPDDAHLLLVNKPLTPVPFLSSLKNTHHSPASTASPGVKDKINSLPPLIQFDEAYPN